MKSKKNPWRHTGLCFVCGKPTVLLIHKPCGEKMAADRKPKRDYAKERYARGFVPDFAKD